MSEVDVQDDYEEKYEGTFYDVLRDNNYTVKEAQELNGWRRKSLDSINNVLAQLTLRRVIPLSIFDSIGGYDNIDLKKKEHLLWMAGLNIKKYPYCKDIGRYHLGKQHVIGWHIMGQERTDKYWTEMVVEGVRVASNEAILSCRKPILNINTAEDWLAQGK